MTPRRPARWAFRFARREKTGRLSEPPPAACCAKSTDLFRMRPFADQAADDAAAEQRGRRRPRRIERCVGPVEAQIYKRFKTFPPSSRKVGAAQVHHLRPRRHE